jgi:hypothetical protein
MATDAIPLCLGCKKNPVNARGLCQRCYARWYHRVKTGKTTWAALEASGLALPIQPDGEARQGKAGKEGG